MKRFSRVYGFTLIEILIALFIFTIIAGILALVLRQILTTREALNYYQKRLNQISLAQLTLHRDLTQIALTAIVLNQEVQASVVGGEHDVVLIRGGEINPLAMEPRSTLVKIHYFLHDHHLIRQITNLFSEKTDTQEQILLDQVNAIQLRYIAPDRRFYAVWPRAQSQVEEAPAGIEFTLNLKDWGSLKQTFIVGGGS